MKLGGLFFGYGGLDLAVQRVFPEAELAWYSEFDKGANKIAAHHFPDVPNHGDITKIDWQSVEPVDILTGGSPCQDLSAAGKRAGMTDGTRSNLWVAMREAIAQLRPGLVVWENVRGAYSAEADSGLEFCAGCMGDAWYRGAALRALGRVLGDLSDLGYDAGWHGLRAADVGAPHGRMRVFVVAYPSGDAGGFGYGDGAATAIAGRLPGVEGRAAGPGEAEGRRPLGDVAGRGLLPTPTTRDHKGRNQRDDESCLTGALLPTPRATDGTKGGPNQRGSSGDLMLPSAVALLPTPAVNDMGAAYTPDEWDAWTDRMKTEHGNGNGHGKSLSIEAARLLPTPRTANNENRQSEGYAGEDGNFYGLLHNPERWGEYAAAIARWEQVLGRPAPDPTMTSAKGNPQLSPAFVEHMMGLPAGWVTDTPGITRNEALKALGNGVVPQQAEAALRFLLPVIERAA